MNNYNTIFNEILKKYGNSEKWSGSIFEKMKLISNTHVGSVGQGIYETQKEDGSSDYYEFIGYICYDCWNETDKGIKEIADWIE